MYRWKKCAAEDCRTIDSWLDEEAVRNTGIDEGWENFASYWHGEVAKSRDKGFFDYIIFFDNTPVAAIAVGWENVNDTKSLTVSEFVVAPHMRRMGHGAKILSELLENGGELVGFGIDTAMAVIYPNNTASKRAFEKAGFVFERAHPDGDALYYIFSRPSPCFCGHDCSRCYLYLGTKFSSEEYKTKAREFYKAEFGIDVPREKLHCMGGRSEDLFYLCEACPFRSCARDKNLASCRECETYPCAELKKYTEKHVNRCGQL